MGFKIKEELWEHPTNLSFRRKIFIGRGIKELLKLFSRLIKIDKIKGKKMKTSARNELSGIVTEVKSGGVMSEVVVKVSQV